MSLFAGLSNIAKLPDLRKRLGYTLLMLAVYRVGVFISIPGVDRNALRAAVAKSGSGFLGLMDMFSGGALGNASIFALGIMPYISASIIMQLFSMVVPHFSELRKEGQAGQNKINQYTRYGCIGLAIFQGFTLATQLEDMSNADLAGAALGEAVLHPGWGFRLMSTLTFTTGTAFVMWVGEQITERGIGNGTSLIIFAGIVDGIPSGVYQYFQTNADNIKPLNLAAVVAVILVTVAIIVFFERGQRRIPIYYARRNVGRRVYGGQTAHLPLKVNVAGTIPPIFASSILSFPGTIAAKLKLSFLADLQSALNRGDWVFHFVYVVLIVFFCFFYTAVTFPAVDLAENLKKQQAFIPSIRQGKQTADYIDKVLTRITLGGAVYVAAVCVIPTMVGEFFRVPFQWGGTSIMIVVGVALDTVSQIETYLLKRNYEGLSGGGGTTSKIRGRRAT